MDDERVDGEYSEDVLHLVDREIFTKAPDVPDELRYLELSPLLAGGLLVLVVHQHHHESEQGRGE